MTSLKKVFLNSICTLIFSTFTPKIFCAQALYVFGESHAQACFAGPFVVPTYITTLHGCTMHRIGRDGLQALDMRKYGVQENDFVVYVFGEVDTRNHIARQLYLHNRDLNEIIDTLVNNYIKTIELNRNVYNNLNSIICGIVPPTNQGYNTFNFYGSLEDRILFTQKMNKKMEREATNHNMLFLNVYDHYATPKGDLKLELSDGNVHISMYHNEFIRELLFQLIQDRLILE